MTSTFGAGRHFFNVTLAPGAFVQRLRAERKKDSPAAYVATLKRVGFDVGPPGPVSRARAVDAMHFVEQRRLEMVGGCGDIAAPVLERGLAEAAPVAGPGAGARFAGNAPGGTPLVPIPGPVAPPAPTVTTSSPAPPSTIPTAPVPSTAPKPRSTPPPPPPPTIPPQLPGSPVLPSP
jgi:hypothetical protein